MHVSIKDIAKAAGVSHSTVSRALSDSSLVKAETKSRIQRLAREMGYTPDAIARSLVLGPETAEDVVNYPGEGQDAGQQNNVLRVSLRRYCSLS